MPTYTNKSNTRTAVLDTAKSEGWVDNGMAPFLRRLQQMQTNPAAYHQNSWQKSRIQVTQLLEVFLIWILKGPDSQRRP